MAEDSQLPKNYQKAKVISGIVASVLIPVAIGLAGLLVNSGIKENELQSKYVELAVSILVEKPEEGTEGIRKWAVDILAKYSPVTLPDEVKNELSANPLANDYKSLVWRLKAMSLGIPDSDEFKKAVEDLEENILQSDDARKELEKLIPQSD